MLTIALLAAAAVFSAGVWAWRPEVAWMATAGLALSFAALAGLAAWQDARAVAAGEAALAGCAVGLTWLLRAHIPDDATAR